MSVPVPVPVPALVSVSVSVPVGVYYLASFAELVGILHPMS